MRTATTAGQCSPAQSAADGRAARSLPRKIAAVSVSAVGVVGAGLLAAGAAQANVILGAVTISTMGDTVTGLFTGVTSSTDQFANCHLAYTAVGDDTILGTGKDAKVPFGGAGNSATLTVPDGTWDIYGYCSDLSTGVAPYVLGPYTYTLQGLGTAPATAGTNTTNSGSSSLLPAGSSVPNILPPGMSGQPAAQ